MIVVRSTDIFLRILTLLILIGISACSNISTKKDPVTYSNPQTVQTSVSPSSEEHIHIPPGGFHVGENLIIRRSTIGCFHQRNLASPIITPPKQSKFEKFFYSAFDGSLAELFGKEPPSETPYLNPQCTRLAERMGFLFYGGITKKNIQIQSKEEKTTILWVPITDIDYSLMTWEYYTSRVITCHGTLISDKTIGSCFQNVDTLGESVTGPLPTKISCAKHFNPSKRPMFTYESWQEPYRTRYLYYQCFPDTFLKTRYHKYLQVWANEGFTPSEGKQWEIGGFLPKEAGKWKRAHFKREEAEKWGIQGITTPEAARKIMAKNLKEENQIRSACPAGVRNFNTLYTNPYTVKGKCYSLAGKFLQLLSRSEALYFVWPFSKNPILIDFSPQPVPDGLWFNGIVKGQGVYKYQSTMGAEEIVPRLKVIKKGS